MTNVTVRENLPERRPGLRPRKDSFVEVQKKLHASFDRFVENVFQFIKNQALVLLGIFLWLVAGILFLSVPDIENTAIPTYTHPMQNALVNWLIAMGKAWFHLFERFFARGFT